MADHRKSFRPRRLAFGGRLLPRGRLLGAALVLLCALAPAHAQDAGLKNGAASLNDGKYDAAVRQLSATVNNERSTPGQAAKALYLRGIAYRKLNKPARAIADLGAAIWLGLPTSDKVRALVNKGLAYKAAGLSSQGDAELARARSASSSATVQKLIAEDGGAEGVTAAATEVASSGQSQPDSSLWNRLVPGFGGSSSAPPPPAPAAPAPASAQTAAAAPTSGWGASVSDGGAPKQSGSGVGGWFKSLTGDSAPAPAATAPAPRTAAAPKTAAVAPSASSWAANTETQKVVSENASGGIGGWFSGSSNAKPGVSAPATAPSGGYRVQLANTRSHAEAQALWKQVQGKNRQLASARPQIEKVDIGSFGTFYSLKVGPFSSRSESTKMCNALKRSGTDCSIVSPEGP